MNITTLESRRYRFDLEPPFAAAWDPVPRRAFEETIVMVHTDEGVTGYAGGAPVPDLELLDRLLNGVNPSDTTAVFGICETVEFHGGRPWTVEVAVWDLLGRIEGRPLWELLGGQRDRMMAYASCGERLPPEPRAERLAAWQQQGLRAAKVRFHHPDWRDDLAVVEAVRRVLGNSMELMVDANQGWRMPGDLAPRWSLQTATDCARALEDFGVYWLEEPLDTHDVESYAALRSRSGVRIAAGEMVRCLPESRRLLAGGGVDVIQNDVVLAGGVTGCREIAELARRLGVVWSPHTWSTGFGLLANLHVALALSNGEYLEVPFDPPAWTTARRDFMLPVPLEIEADGTIAAPPGPGLGVTPDLAFLERFRVG